MAYEVFEKKSMARRGTPVMSISKLGQVVFNQPAAGILQKEAIERVLLLWDSSAKKLALKATSNKNDPRAYTIRFNPKGNGASFSAKTFLDYIGVDFEQRKQLAVEINTNSEYFIETKIPDSFFRKQIAQVSAI
jgi:hypothetical protein